ncbi:hypothetical protein WJX73_010892 [Symbiochloris irregularis]|uniref:Uncharacterized protein n=1 Tax=Symbiochloris irregularis TaxID=706552 RepID=A0AAW1PEZ2_9CHLO
MSAEASSVLILLLGTPVALTVATIGLVQFKVLLLLLTNLSQRRGNAKIIRQGTRYLVRHFEATFGPAQNFAPNTTHVILVAILLAILLSAERMLSRMGSRHQAS